MEDMVEVLVMVDGGDWPEMDEVGKMGVVMVR